MTRCLCWLAIYDAAIVTWHCLGLSSWPAAPFSDEETDRNCHTGQAWLGFLGSHILNWPRTTCIFSTLSFKRKEKRERIILSPATSSFKNHSRTRNLAWVVECLLWLRKPSAARNSCGVPLLQSPTVTKAISRSAGLHVAQIMTTVSRCLNVCGYFVLNEEFKLNWNIGILCLSLKLYGIHSSPLLKFNFIFD